MQREVQFDKIDQFIAGVTDAGVTRVIVAWAKEIRSTHQEDTTYKVGPYRKVELIAYRDATLYKYIDQEADADSLVELLTEAGLETEKVDRNIV